ncbi:MAG: glycoside hydrolase family 127 protein [Verrucomicrobia bacterium]|nr:glycoside hydrolase family 127 protein [Verrucomicrobiota bacterium]
MNQLVFARVRPPRQSWLQLLGGLAAACCVTTASLAADALTPLNLRDVQVGGEIGRRITITITNNLLVLDADHDFLASFKAKTNEGGYIGLGKLIDATVKFAAETGDPRVLALKQHLVDETIKAQAPDGYLGQLAPAQRVRGFWDIHEMGYVIWGLLTDYKYFGDERSLAAARKGADYLLRNWSTLPPDWGHKIGVAPYVAVTGLERTMLALHRQTGAAPYLDFVTKTRALPEWELPIVIGRRPGIEGHIYAYLARCLAQLELYRHQPDHRLLGQTDRALDFMLNHDGLQITGGAGQCEIWTDDQDGRGDLGETCSTAYQLRVYDNLLRLRGDARLGDLIERTIYNALFAAQSPDGRRLRYFSPTEGGRVYFPLDTYCCPCNFRRIVAELPAMVFYRAHDGLAVNLYTTAEAKLSVGKNVPLTIRQATDYLNSGRIRLQLDPARPVKFPLQLRIPAWARGASVTVNGRPAKGAGQAGRFFALTREWKSGDEVSLNLQMSWRLVKGRQRQAGRVAVMRGPQLFCLNPAQNPAIAKLDGTELGYLALDPASLTDPVPSDVVRPEGLGCRVKAWKAGFGIEKKADFTLTLTEFPDPDGKATYFRLRDFSVAVDDELLAGKSK